MCAGEVEPGAEERGGGAPADGTVSFGGMEAKTEGFQGRGREADGLPDPEKEGKGESHRALGEISGGEFSVKELKRKNQVLRGRGGARRVVAVTTSQQARGRVGESGRLVEATVRAARKMRAVPGRGRSSQ